MGRRRVLTAGTRILDNKYEVLKCIHNKGMANVYMVRDTTLGGVWCMKEIVKSEAGKNNIEYIGILNEANVLRRLNHPSIPRIALIDEDEDSLLIIEDWVDGNTLQKFIEAKTRVRQDMAVAWMKQICNIMLYLHSETSRKKPVFYRDMKPENIIIQSDGNIKLLDFGVSIILEEEGQIPKYPAGTKGYAPPEQKKKNLPCDLRSDIYATGMTFYHMLTGLSPVNFERSELRPIQMLAPDVSKGLIRVVEKCIEENPDDRYQDFTELLYALQNYEELDTEYRRKSVKKVKIVLGLGILGLILSLSSLIPRFVAKSQEDSEYDRLVAVAEQSGKQEDYEAAINMRPTNLGPYGGYLGTIRLDGKFSFDEEKKLLGFINPNLAELKKSSDFPKLAYDIGRLYWLYYEGSLDDSKVLSIRWFEDSINGDYNKESATVYKSIGDFKKNIQVSIKELTDGGLYKKYWSDLQKVREIEGVGELIEIQINTSIAECISAYAYNLRRDGVSYEDVAAELARIKSFVEAGESFASSEALVEGYEKLSKILNGVDEKVSSAYAIGGGS